jgi:hypothetical protein
LKKALIIIGITAAIGLSAGALVVAVSNGSGEAAATAATTTVTDTTADTTTQTESDVSDTTTETEPEVPVTIEDEEPEVEPTDCDALGINREVGNEGTCTDGKWEVSVVDAGGTAKIDTLAVTHNSTEVVESVSSGWQGTKEAKGQFVIVSISVENLTHRPQYLGGDQGELLLGRDSFTEAFNAANGYLNESCTWKMPEIQPGQSATCSLIFDVPEDAAASLEKNGNVWVYNFGDSGSYSWANNKQVAVIRTYQ